MRTFEYCNGDEAKCSSTCKNLIEQVIRNRDEIATMHSDYPGLLSSLQEQAFFDNVDSSTRIEGIYLDQARVRELASGTSEDPANPTSDHEQQVAGYARTLRAIEKNPEFFTISTSTLLAMHTVLFTGRSFDTRSRYRRKDYIDMVGQDGSVQRVKVSPINAFETPLCLGAMCDELAERFPTAKPDAQLLAIPRFVVDFLCVRPFTEGNGRLARLFTQLLMLSAGFDIARYISIDRLLEQDGMAYYDALNACVEGWDRKENDYEPFAVYWLGRVHDAYRDLLARGNASTSESTLSKSERVAHYFDRHVGRCTKQDIAAANPDISISTIENALRELVKSGRIRMVGSGRGAAYENAN